MLSEAQHTQAGLVPLQGDAFDLMVLEFAVASLARGLDAFGNLNSAVLFAATTRACGPFGRTEGGKRPISINALAASLGRPFETTRRHANALLEEGLVARSSTGLSVHADALSDPRITRLTDGCHDLLVRLIENLADGGFALPAAAGDHDYEPQEGIAIALDLMLAAVECHGRREENFTRLALLLAIEWAERRVGQAVPDKSSGPVIRTSAVARILGLPYATTSRNVDALIAAGSLARVGPGLRATENDLAMEARTTLAMRARQLVGRLAFAGFGMDRPDAHYIHARPPVADAA